MNKINQWNIWQRSLLLCVMTFMMGISWYFFLEKPLLEKNKGVMEQQTNYQTLLEQLQTFLALRHNFIYKNELKFVQLQQVFQGALSEVSGLQIKSYSDNPPILLPTRIDQFSKVTLALNLSLLKFVRQSSATLVFSGGFNSFLAYLKVLQMRSDGIYFDSLDFNMNRYPKAEITMKVFTLEGV